MASTRMAAPMRRLSRLSIRQDAMPVCCTVCRTAASQLAVLIGQKLLSTTTARSIATSAPAHASISSITTSADEFVPIKPFEEQTVLATIHKFPSLEPLRFQRYPANHLYLPTRRDILHRAIIYEGDKTRSGTASTKTRYEIRGSAKKIRPQKGSGRARLGDKKSPMLRGGGVAFGPRPRDFSTELQKKVYDLAWRTALSYRFRKGELIIVDNTLEIESPSVRLLSDIFDYHDKLRGRGRSLLVTLEDRPLLSEALEEMERSEALTWREVDVKNLLEGSRVIIERDALHNILLSHQEDLTHRALPPWNTSLIPRSPPTDLESTPGWQEFRALALTGPKEKEAVRIGAYESAAASRYAYAQSLPPSLQRTELETSTYRLVAEMKELEFLQSTGLPFSDYLQQDDPDAFPRIQTLNYQIAVKSELATAASSHRKGDELMLEVRQLEVKHAEIVRDATLLAAERHENMAEAHALVGAEEEAEIVLNQAGTERTNLDNAETKLLEATLAVAEQKFVVARVKKDYFAQQSAKQEGEECTRLLEAKRAEVRLNELQVLEAQLEEAKQKFFFAESEGDSLGQQDARREIDECTEILEAKRVELGLGEVEEVSPAEIEVPRTTETRHEEKK